MILLTTRDNIVWKRLLDKISERMTCARCWRLDPRYIESLLGFIAVEPYVILYDQDDADDELKKKILDRLSGRPFIGLSAQDTLEDAVAVICAAATKLVGENHQPMNKVWRDRAAAIDIRERLREVKAVAVQTLQLYLRDGPVEFGLMQLPTIHGLDNVMGYAEDYLTYQEGKAIRRKDIQLSKLSAEDLIRLIATTEELEKYREQGKERHKPSKPTADTTTTSSPGPLPEAPDDGDQPF